jgi:hypothetical protein
MPGRRLLSSSRYVRERNDERLERGILHKQASDDLREFQRDLCAGDHDVRFEFLLQ